MSREVDQHVVQMVFDNEKFEKNAKETMSTLDKLKEKLGFGDASDGFDKLDDAAGKVNFNKMEEGVDRLSDRFSNLGVIGMAALQNITNKAIMAGEQLFNALVVDAPKAGWREYELQQNTIQTIMSGTGESLETVKAQLDELNDYADKTIYVFSDMTQNISKFTNQGIHLDTATAAIKGISNVAALAGANASQASHAMYNFAQALGQGSVKLIDWRSIQNAQMDTVQFKDTLIEMAGAMGTLQKKQKANGETMYYYVKKTKTGTQEIEVTAENFMHTLSEGWLTNDVLLQSLGIFAGEASEETLRALGFSDEMIAKYIQLGLDAQEAATQVKTASQLFDTLKEAAGTGWAKSFEYIFGDFNQAKKFFTGISQLVGGELDKTADKRNNFLKKWNEGGGYDAFTGSIMNVITAIIDLKKLISSGFEWSFIDLTGTQGVNALIGFTKNIESVTKSISEALKKGDVANFITKISKGFSSGIRIVFDFFSAFGGAVGSLIRQLSPFFKIVMQIVGDIGMSIFNLSKKLIKNKTFKKFFGTIEKMLKPVTVLINYFGSCILDVYNNIKKWATENKVVEKIGNVIGGVAVLIAFAVGKLATIVPKVWDKVKGFFTGLKTLAQPILNWLNPKITAFTDAMGKIANGDLSGVTELFDKLKGKLDEGVKAVQQWFEDLKKNNPVIKSISDFFSGIWKSVSNFLKPETIFLYDKEKHTFSVKKLNWWDKLVAYFENGKADMDKWFEENIQPIINSVSGFFNGIWTGIDTWIKNNFGAVTEEVEIGDNLTETVTVPWYQRIIGIFTNGYEEIKKFFTNLAENPVIKAITGFFSNINTTISSFFADQTDENGNTTTWWDRVTQFFQEGYAAVEEFFTNLAENPVIKAITGFFNKIRETLGGLFKKKEPGLRAASMVSVSDVFGGKLTKKQKHQLKGEEGFWYDLIDYFEDGYDAIEQFFTNLAENPVIKAITGFFSTINTTISSFFADQTDENGNTTTWWDRVTQFFQEGYAAVEEFFTNLAENPAIKAIKNFFTELSTTISTWITDNFGTITEEVEIGDNLTETVTVPWYQRIINIFVSGYKEIKKFFTNLAENPVIIAISGFFTTVSTTISDFFADKTDENGNTTTWWQRVTKTFQDGYDAVEEFFGSLTENPVVKAIMDFFGMIYRSIKSFFITTTDQNGTSVTWWSKIKAFFIDGKQKVVAWFETQVALNPVIQAIGDFFSGIYAKLVEFATPEEKQDGTVVYWWDKITGYITEGFGKVKTFFGDLRKKNPLVDNIMTFFENAWKKISAYISDHFGTITYTQEVEIGDNLTETQTITVPWYQRVIDFITEGIDKIVAWVEDQKENNPVVKALSEFGSGLWGWIQNLFVPGSADTSEFEQNVIGNLTQVETALSGVVDFLGGADMNSPIGKGVSFVGNVFDNLLFRSASAEEEVEQSMTAVTDQFSKATETVANDAKDNANKPITIFTVFGNVLKLIGQVFVAAWNALGEIIKQANTDTVFAFLDKLLHYWNAFSFGNLALAIRDIASMAAYKEKAEVLRSLAAVFGAIAAIAMSAVGFATLPVEKMIVGFGFLMVLLGGLGMIIHFASKMEGSQGSDSKAIARVEQAANSISTLFGSAAVIGAITTVISAVSGSIGSAWDVVKELDPERGWMQILQIVTLLLGSLAVAGIFGALFSKGSGLLTSLISSKMGTMASSLGLDLKIGSLNQTNSAGDSSIQKIFSLTGSGLENLSMVLEVAIALKSITGALSDIIKIMKDNKWDDFNDFAPTLEVLGAIVMGLVGIFAVDNWAKTMTDKKIVTKPGAGSDAKDIKQSIGAALENAANILAIAEAVNILVGALQPMIDIQHKYGNEGRTIADAIGNLSLLLGEVFVVFEANEWLQTLIDRKVVDKNNGNGGAEGSNKTTSIIAAMIEQPILAMAGAVWIIANALGVLMDSLKKAQEAGETNTSAMWKMTALITAVFGANGLMKVITKLTGKFDPSTIVTFGMLAAGVTGLLMVIQDIMQKIDTFGETKYTEAALASVGVIVEVLAALFVAVKGIDALSEMASDKKVWLAVGLIAAIGLILGALVYGGIKATEIFLGFMKKDIPEGISAIVDAVHDINEEDMKKIERLGSAMESIAGASAITEGTSLGWFGYMMIGIVKAAGGKGTGDTLADLGEKTQEFSAYVPGILANIQSAVGQVQAFQDFAKMAVIMADVAWITWENVDVFENLEKNWSIFKTASGYMADVAGTLASKSSSYGPAVLGLEFLFDLIYMLDTMGSPNYTKVYELDGFLEELAKNSTFAKDLGAFTANVAEAFSEEFGDSENIDKVTGALDRLAQAIERKKQLFIDAGEHFTQGFVDGIKGVGYKNGSVYNAGQALALKALTGLNDGMDANSPSKETYTRGGYFVAGFVNAMDDGGGHVYRSGEDLAFAAMDGMQSVLSGDLSSSLDDDFLTIRPVMDMSDIQNGMDTIDSYTHQQRQFTYGTWNRQASVQAAGLGNYSRQQAYGLSGADLTGADIVYDDGNVVALLQNIRTRMDDIDALNERLQNMQVVLDSGAIVGGIANKMNRRLGVLASREERRS